MSWQPTARWERLRQRAGVLVKVRQFLEQRGLVEVETPCLARYPVTDVYLDSIAVPLGKQTYYLQTSPEYHMKRLLAAGAGSIYQISKAFRRDEHGRWHNLEFTLLEWYRLHFDDWQLMDEVDALLQAVLAVAPACRMSYQEAWLRFIDLDPLDLSLSAAKRLAKAHHWPEDLPLVTYQQLIMSELIEPQLAAQEQVYFIYHYPSNQAALARLHPQDSRIALRFEVYYRGVELANGFAELTDASIQRTRFIEDNARRTAQGLPSQPIDTLLLAALEAGLPECAGVALGIDRLCMLALGCQQVSEVMAFPFAEPT